MPTLSRQVVSVLIAALAVLGGSSIAAGQGSQDSRLLVVGVPFDIKSLDPARAFEPAGIMVLKATYDTLLTLDEHDVSKVVPDLAESWEVSPDARTFTFHLRHGVTFQGSANPMTSADVRWSLERAMGIHGNPSFLLDGITSIETPDDHTIVVSKNDPDPAFIAKTTSPVFSVLDSMTVEAHGGISGPDAAAADAAEDWLNQNSAGTGPFSMTSYTPESEVDLQASSAYWNGPPSFDRVIYRNIPDAATQKLTLQAGGIDIATTISADQVPSLRADPNVSVVEGSSPIVFYLMMNQQADLSHGTMSNPDVQRAVRYALAYDGINQLVGGPAVTPPSVLPQGFLGAYPPERAVRRDVNRAKGLLVQAGFPNGLNVDLEYPTNYSNSGVSFDVVAQKIQADLSDVGINVTLKPGDFQTALANYRAGTEGFGFWLWTPDYFDSNDYLAFLPGGVLAKRANWTDANADPAIEQLRDQINVETDPTRRARLWQQAQDDLMANGPWAMVVEPGAYIATRANVANYAYNPDWIVNPYVLSKQ